MEHCIYCNDGEMYEEREKGHLLEIKINKRKRCLEVHYCGSTVLDYEDIKIAYCPFCGRKL